MIRPRHSTSSIPGRGADRRRRHLVPTATVSSEPRGLVTHESPRQEPRLPILFITGEFGLAGALQAALPAAVDVHIAPRWDDAICVASARAWPVILLDCATTVLPLNQALAVLRRCASGSRLLCLLPASASEALAAHAADGDGVLRKPLDVNAIRWHVHQFFGSTAITEDLMGWNRHVNNVFAYMSEHYHEPLRVETLARAIGISPGHLVHLFPAEISTSVRTCLMRVRYEVAKHALTWTDDKLDVVAERAGFCDASHLSRVFRVYARKQPGAFRRHVRSGPGPRWTPQGMPVRDERVTPTPARTTEPPSRPIPPPRNPRSSPERSLSSCGSCAMLSASTQE